MSPDSQALSAASREALTKSGFDVVPRNAHTAPGDSNIEVVLFERQQLFIDERHSLQCVSDTVRARLYTPPSCVVTNKVLPSAPPQARLVVVPGKAILPIEMPAGSVMAT